MLKRLDLIYRILLESVSKEINM